MRVTATVDNRSSQWAIGISRRASKFAANWRTDWQRGPLAAVHVEGKPDDEPANPFLVDQGEEAFGVGLKLSATQSLTRCGDPEGGVREGDTDGFRAHIEAHQALARVQAKP